MEKLMRVWAKISSLVLIFFLILGMYYTIKILFLLMEKTPFWVIFLPFTWFFMIVFYSPLFYFGWIKKPKSEIMEMWAKVLTIIFPVLAVISFISPWGLEFPKNIFSIIPAFLLIVPLYYYAWRD